MGLLVKLGDSQEITLTPQGGLLLAAVTMARIDGNIDDDEAEIIARRLSWRSGGASDLKIAVEVSKAKPVEECVTLAAHSMSANQQLVTMINLIDIALVDCTLADDEKVLIDAYANAFNIPSSEVEKIMHIIVILKDSKHYFNQE